MVLQYMPEIAGVLDTDLLYNIMSAAIISSTLPSPTHVTQWQHASSYCHMHATILTSHTYQLTCATANIHV